MNKRFYLILSAIIAFFINYGPAANAQNEDKTSSIIKSVYFEKNDLKPTYPIIKLSAADVVTLNFDLLADDAESMNYKLVHCDRDWNTSDLFYTDYMDGFEENTFTSYGSSFNTTVKYSHYQLSLPNDDVRFKISGNYLLKIYRTGEEEFPVLQRRIMVYEGSAPMKVTYRRPAGKEFNSGQQTEVKISTTGIDVTDPSNQISLTILQNGRWDKSKAGIKPDFIGDGTVEYNTLTGSTLFKGGNEFRCFDIKNIRQKLQNVLNIDFIDGNYHVFLIPSDNRDQKQYFYNEDLNGMYYIAVEGSEEPSLDADYVYVHFSLPSAQEVKNGQIYVTGAMNNWEYNNDNRMIYNPEKKEYEGSLLLKQGWYNFEYVCIPENKKQPEGTFFEGSHYETENDYLLVVYFHDPHQRYDRLLECSITNSAGK